MRSYLSRSVSSINENKLNGLLAEIDFRHSLRGIGFQDRVSQGGWIARRVGDGEFGHDTVVMFPEPIIPGKSYEIGRALPQPPNGLHAIAATFHQSGINAFFCAPEIGVAEDPTSVSWQALQLGVPSAPRWQRFPQCVQHRFSVRQRPYQFLRYRTDCSRIPDAAISEEFSKENLRVVLQTSIFAQISDVDGIFWGQQFTYPLEIKEKTAATDPKLGKYFGLDLGPFVKLAFYAAKRGNLRSLFIVKEISDVSERDLVDWWFITFDKLAEVASWVPRSGGRSMTGGASSVVQIPKAEFSRITAAVLNDL